MATPKGKEGIIDRSAVASLKGLELPDDKKEMEDVLKKIPPAKNESFKRFL